MTYTNSPLVNYTKLSPNHSGTRTHIIDTITIHCYVGQASVESAGDWFGKSSTQASCNYMIGADGRIGLIVEEKNRSWCTSSNSNDQRAVTIECACDKTHPYAVNDKVYTSLINLVADICKRNGIKKLLWEGDKSLIGNVARQNMTVHRWFKNKACPGEYLYTRHGDIANQVNIKLGTHTVSTVVPSTEPFYIKVANVDKNDVLNIREEPNAKAKITGKLAYNDPNTYTIVEVKNGWGKLKSGLGWVNLSYTKTVSDGATTTPQSPNTTPAPKPVVQKSLDVWAQEVIAGKHGSGHANREASLKKAGCTYSYDQVRAKVNALCGVKTTTATKPTKSLDAWAREVIAGKHGTGHSKRAASLKNAGCTYSYEKVRARVNELLK